jgi:hypothetical protein
MPMAYLDEESLRLMALVFVLLSTSRVFPRMLCYVIPVLAHVSYHSTDFPVSDMSDDRDHTRRSFAAISTKGESTVCRTLYSMN